ncbi:MAG: substrate-binding domain-containing protein, partial [Planctomycetota bacterium]|nr:substrate-binding domain-containing protein [Planctomycetota bacterium]
MRPSGANAGSVGVVETRLLVGSALLLGLLLFFLLGSDRMPAGTSGPISVYCAAGLQPPVVAAARAYEDQYDIKIVLDYGGSGTLLSKLSVAQSGDLYIAADDSYISSGREKGFIEEDLSLASQVPVLAVARGNPKKVRSLRDLLRDDISVGFAHPEAAAVGRIARRVLTEGGLWQEVKARVTVFKPTVMDLANSLKIGAIDLAVIWDATAAQYPEIEEVRVEAFDARRQSISLGVLSWSEQPTAALRFARYLAARDAGLPHFAKLGYAVVDGDRWEETPELELMSGAMLNKAIDETVTEFEQREGVRVTKIYNGCGILVSQMKSGGRPDAYFSCDQSFLDQVSERF